jgi:hypothetical protein
LLKAYLNHSSALDIGKYLFHAVYHIIRGSSQLDIASYVFTPYVLELVVAGMATLGSVMYVKSFHNSMTNLAYDIKRYYSIVSLLCIITSHDP